MGSFYQTWGSYAADASINGATITNGGTLQGTAVSNSNKTASEVSVEIVYGGTYTADVILYFLRDVDGTNLEDVNTGYGITIPGAVGATRRRVFSIPADVAGFTPFLSNPSGASVTATVRVRQSTGGTV